jgi:hypothetical protein
MRVTALRPCTAAGIGERGGLALGHAMSASATLQACTVATCALPVQALRGAAPPPAEGASEAAEAAEAAEVVELGQRELTEVDALLIGAMMGANTTLRRLALHGNALCGVRDGWGSFSCCGLRAVAAGLGANTAMLALDLSQNALCAVEAYASGVQGNTASAADAEPLRLECVQALHDALVVNKSLAQLSLRGTALRAPTLALAPTLEPALLPPLSQPAARMLSPEPPPQQGTRCVPAGSACSHPRCEPTPA